MVLAAIKVLIALVSKIAGTISVCIFTLTTLSCLDYLTL